MPSFDIDTLISFTPPAFACPRCRALLNAPQGAPPRRCPVCSMAWPGDDAERLAAFEHAGLRLFHRDAEAIYHSQRLAQIARAARDSLRVPTPDYTPMRALLESFSSARRFVHFTTFGISAMLLGALKLASLQVSVRGVVSGVRHDAMVKELSDYTNETPELQMRLFQNDSPYFPHQKIIVIDGLMAFKGSANMTDFGWRKAAQGREVIELVTDLAEVAELHNRFFSPVWATFEPPLEMPPDQAALSDDTAPTPAR